MNQLTAYITTHHNISAKPAPYHLLVAVFGNQTVPVLITVIGYFSAVYIKKKKSFRCISSLSHSLSFISASVWCPQFFKNLFCLFTKDILIFLIIKKDSPEERPVLRVPSKHSCMKCDHQGAQSCKVVSLTEALARINLD